MNFKVIFFISVILLSGIFYYQLTGNVVAEKQQVFFVRAVDGDTFEFNNGLRARLLGINTPEKNQLGYQEAKDFLKKFENKTIEIESHGTDKYGRFLVYTFYNNELINKKILEGGLASLYYYNRDDYYNEMKKSEEEARKGELGIWKKSANYGCLKIKEFNPIDKAETENETLILENVCDFSLNITIKDDATHIYNKIISNNSVLEMHFKNIFNDDGDSLYIYDFGGLVLFYRY